MPHAELPPGERLILALDGLNGAEAEALTLTIAELRWVKVGLELFVAAGPGIVKRLRRQGLQVFLDLKFHDIPATMAAACRRAAALGANLVTVHASAGVAALEAAQQAVATSSVHPPGSPPATRLLAVTVLTSWQPADFNRELAINEDLNAHVCRLAQLAAAAGIHGCVCSPRDVALVRASHPELHLVTPGVRPRGADPDDQARTLTPEAAVQTGANQLVVGRPVTRAADPAAAFRSMCDTIGRGTHR